MPPTPTSHPALLIFTLGKYKVITFGSSGEHRLMIYGFQQGSEPYLLLHATNPNDRRFKGHKGVLSVPQFRALAEEILKRGDCTPILHFEGTQVRLKLQAPLSKPRPNGLGVTSDLKRERISMRVDFEEELPAALAAIEQALEVIPRLTTITLDL